MVLSVLHDKSKINPIRISSFFINHLTAVGLFYPECALSMLQNTRFSEQYCCLRSESSVLSHQEKYAHRLFAATVS